jgi:hypothetical protein
MTIAGYQFKYIGEIRPALNADGSVRLFFPQPQYQNKRGLALNRYGDGAFCKFKITRLIQASGVYILVIDNEVRYVGECVNLSARFNSGYGNISPRNCYKGGQETNCRINKLVCSAALAGKQVSLLFFQTVGYKAMEAALRSAVKAAWNLA